VLDLLLCLDGLTQKSLCCLLRFIIGGCWFVIQFILVADSYAVMSCKARTTFFFYLVSRPFVGSLDSSYVVCALASVFFKPLLMFDLFVYQFGLKCGMTGFWLSPSILYFLLH
jgi:uncharacterized membrane protein